MHGLVNHAVQCFVRDAYGAEAWRKVSRAAGVGPEGFEPMLDYDDHVTHDLLLAAARHLGKAPEALLEDLGTYLVSHDSQRSVRRLLRFSGATFSDFLHALDDLPSRAKLAMPDLDLPELELREDPPGCFRLFVLARQPAWGYVMLGLLRAMADDFGALVVIDIAPGTSSVTVIEISLHDGAFAAGRSFSLARAEPGADMSAAPPDTPGGTSSGARIPSRESGGAAAHGRSGAGAPGGACVPSGSADPGDGAGTARANTVHANTVRANTARADAAHGDAAHGDAAHGDVAAAARADAPRADAPRNEAARPGTARADAPLDRVLSAGAQDPAGEGRE